MPIPAGRISPRQQAPFGLFLTFAVVVLVFLQGSLFLSMADKTVGTHFFGPGLNPDGTPPVGPARVALLRSENSAKWSAASPEFFYNLTRQWEIALKEAGIDYKIVSDKELASGLGKWPNVLILPSAVCLSDAEQNNIRAMVDAGDGLVASGAIGARKGDCSWRGWSYLSELTGLRSPEAVSLTGQSYGAFRGGQFFSSGVPAGYSFDIPPQEVVVAGSDTPDVVWTDWRLRPQRDSIANSALAIHGVRNRGRFVWYGFKETLPLNRKTDRDMLDHFMIDNVRWAGRQPVANLAEWPEGKTAAVMIAEQVEGDGADAESSALLFKSEGVPATFFCRSKDAAQFAAMLPRLEAAGEIASSGDSADPLVLENQQEEFQRVSRARRDLERIAASHIFGFNPPEALWDDGTVSALNNAGYGYYIDHYGGGRGVPELIEAPHVWWQPTAIRQIARIRRTAPDDFEVIADYKGPTPYGDDLADPFVGDFRRNSYFGVLHTLMIRDELLASRENSHILKNVVERIKQQPVWIASGEAIAKWWGRRERVRIESRTVTGRRIRVSVTNRGSDALENATVYVHLPYRPQNIRVIPSILGRSIPHTRLMPGEDVLRMDFRRLDGQSSSVLILALDEGE